MTSPFVQKAETNLKSAKMPLDAGGTDNACSRAYYATYDAAWACLAWARVAPEERGTFRTHNGLIAAFGLHIVKPGLASSAYKGSIMMDVNLRKIEGNWDDGYALDKHIVSSVYTGDNQFGHPTFSTTRTQVGEAVFQLKYRQDWSQAPRLAAAVAKNAVPLLGNIGLVVPMPASTARTRQPVTEVARELAKLLNVNSFEELLIKNATPDSNKSLRVRPESLLGIA